MLLSILNQHTAKSNVDLALKDEFTREDQELLHYRGEANVVCPQLINDNPQWLPFDKKQQYQVYV